MSDASGSYGVREGPAGLPIGRALDIRPGIAYDDLREAVLAIERVHGDGRLPRIPMLLSRDTVPAHGHQVDGLFRTRIDAEGAVTPISIHLRSGSSFIQFVALHEIGHFLDANGLPGKDFSSESGQVLRTWRQSVRQSRAYQELEELATADDLAVSARARGFMAPDELWARSYAQFIVIRDRRELLRSSLDALRRWHIEGVYFPCQWDDDDFAPIEAVIAGLFRRLGWIA